MCFDGFDLPRINILNYGDISAQEVAERLLTCWNKHVYESVEAIQGWKLWLIRMKRQKGMWLWLT